MEDQLREAATLGDGKKLRQLLERGANPCSQDELGLTALHYAVWNSHERSVELLCANDIGRDSSGKQRSCISLQSSRGETALGLAAAESTPKIITILLRNGARDDLMNIQGQTPLEVAVATGRPEAVLEALRNEVGDVSEMKEYRKKMLEHLRVQRARLIPKPDGDGKRLPPRPIELMLDEEEILPFAKLSFAGKHCKTTIQNLVLAKEQADINVKRRDKLAYSCDRKYLSLLS